MHKYTNAEMADMHFMYGRANGNATEARRMYAEEFPNRLLPSDKIFSRLHIRLSETGSFKINGGSGRPRSVSSPAVELDILRRVEDNPNISTRRLAAELNVSHPLIWRILREQQLYPYRIQRVLAPLDYDAHRVFCHWVLRKLAETSNFATQILFSDEAGFTRDGIFNFHNNHVWADENPHAVVELHHQNRFSLNVWLAIFGDCLIGAFVQNIKIYYNTKEYVVRPVLKRADSVKQIGNSVLSSKYTTYAADKLDGALDVADKYVDKYLPDDVNDSQGNEESEPNNAPNKALQTIQHMDRLSRKLQRRLTKRTLAEARALKEHSAEAIHVLAYVAELIVTDPKLAFQKGKELWSSLSQDEPENQARPDNLEQLVVLLTRESARRVVHLVNFTTNSVGRLPRGVIKYMRRSADACVQVIRSIIKEHLASILAEIQQSAEQQEHDHQKQSKKQTTIRITKPTNQTYQLSQDYETLQPPTSPNAHIKARHIANGMECAAD